jgi:hypothetical protein
MKRIEGLVALDPVSSGTRVALLSAATVGRGTVALALGLGLDPPSPVAKWDPLACAALGAAVIPAIPWLGALLGGGGCIMANVQESELCELDPDNCPSDD